MLRYLLAIDQGTTSSRAILFDTQGKLVAQYQIEIQQIFPHNGWVEHDPENIWQTVVDCIQAVIKAADIDPAEIAALGISNQREATVLWDRVSGRAIYNVIGWQDRRTAELCQQLSQDADLVDYVQQNTGLLLDPYFSATKIAWILEHVAGARAKAERGELAFGTIDSYLLWKLTGGKAHATDVTNASRTLLFNIKNICWDKKLLKQFNIPEKILPEVKSSNARFGAFTFPTGESIPICGVLGDQQAALFGHACFTAGEVKSTYGTGCFVLYNTATEPVYSKNKLLTTIAAGIDGQITYGLEGSIFVAGAAVQWLRDALHLIANANETEKLALELEDNGGVYLVPAFTGLGAPYWDPQARGALLGLTRDSGVAHIVRAALEAICYQTKDLLGAMEQDGIQVSGLHVDGGMTHNHWLMQFLTDILDLPITLHAINETSALGAALMAGLGASLYKSLAEIKKLH